MSTPLISAVMPAYNSESYIGESIESILNQSYKNFEFIIINDGSTDQTKQIIESYQDPRIRLINHQDNQGLVKSLNQGIKLARGQFIARMDSDDMASPDRFQTQLDYMLSHQKVGVCGSWIKVFGNQNFIWKSPILHDKICTRLFCESSIYHPSVVIRKSVLDKYELSYDQAYEYAEDYALWIEMAKHSQLANIPKVLLKYRQHSAQVSRARNQVQTKANEKIKLSLLKNLLKSYTQSEADIHLKSVSWYKGADEETLSLVRSWYQKLIFANREKNIYPHVIFLGELADHWIAICYLSKLGLIKYLYVFTYPELAIRGYARLIKRKLGYV